MAISSGFAIYALFWVLCAFLMLPFGLRTPHEEGHAVEAGHAESAPVNFRPRVVILRATILSAVLFGLFLANYFYGWVGVEDVNLFGEPPAP